MKNKKINPQEYHQWAFQHYKIPRLKVTFFQKNKINKDLLDRYTEVWPDHVVPIKEWKGTLYLACLEPVPSLQIEQKNPMDISPFGRVTALENRRGI